MYARSAIPKTRIAEARISDPRGDTIEVHSRPVGGEYPDTHEAKRGESAPTRTVPNPRVAVDDVLGPQQPSREPVE